MTTISEAGESYSVLHSEFAPQPEPAVTKATGTVMPLIEIEVIEDEFAETWRKALKES